METLKTKQQIFNEIRGSVFEWNVEDEWSNLVIEVGHDNKRKVNLVCKTKTFNRLVSNLNISKGVAVVCRFYIASRKSNDRYYTNATLLTVHKI
jgi:hypothetical protein